MTFCVAVGRIGTRTRNSTISFGTVMSRRFCGQLAHHSLVMDRCPLICTLFVWRHRDLNSQLVTQYLTAMIGHTYEWKVSFSVATAWGQSIWRWCWKHTRWKRGTANCFTVRNNLCYGEQYLFIFSLLFFFRMRNIHVALFCRAVCARVCLPCLIFEPFDRFLINKIQTLRH